MSPLRCKIRRRMLPWVRSETQYLAELQARWRTPFLDSYFTLTAFAGHPLFFVCILPIMFWYGHSVFARGFVNVACVGVFVTSWVKDYLCLPRPLSPPLIRLSRSKRVHLEYGFPSTHTSNATSIALYLLSYLLISDWSFPTKVLSIMGLVVYLFSVVFGRLYCGMHTMSDLVGGAVIGVVVWAVQWTFHDTIDDLMTHSSWTVVLIVVLGGIVLIQSIPETMDSCPCVDDGITTMAVLMGVFPASQHFALSKYSITAAGHAGIVSYDPALGLPRSILRFVFGLAVVFSWRMAAKKLLYIVLPPLYSYFNLPSRTHFVPAKTYGNLRRQPIGRVPSVMDLQALSDSSIEIVGTQSTMDIHEQFSQSRSSKRSSMQFLSPGDTDIEKKEHFGLRPKARQQQQQQQEQQQLEKDVAAVVESLESLDEGLQTENQLLDECEREAMEKFEAEHPGWARFDVDIVIKTVVYAGIGWLAVDTIPIMFEYIGLDTPPPPPQQKHNTLYSQDMLLSTMQGPYLATVQQHQLPPQQHTNGHTTSRHYHTSPIHSSNNLGSSSSHSSSTSPTSSSTSPSSTQYQNQHHHHHTESGGSGNSSDGSTTKRYYHRQFQQEGAITVEEYEEVLNAEVWVEIPKLREYARHGVPRQVRGEVWLYLLDIQDANRSKEVSTQKQRAQEFELLDKEPNDSTKRVRGEVSRYLRKTLIESSRDIPRLFEEVISAYCNQNHQAEYYPGMVSLCAPFVYSIKREWDAYLCFEKMMTFLNDHQSEESINESVAKFMTLFHTCIPDLFSYFEEEEVDIKEWAASALQFMLSRELPLENTMRLWDTYFAIPNGGWIELHPFFCLAILKHLKEGFEDLEQSEIRTTLMRLPWMDLDQIINEAFNMRHDLMERQVSDDSL
ncbi:hypothetical protein BGZ83_007276 [Gryganskiella cystojenkinii]|nr:hypothetical protein BGZ83_007276 [Gryganskiella cystojenkinii]